jgi:subtilisin-like proprotein convertase family protein
MRNPLILALVCASSAPAAIINLTDSVVTTIPDGSGSGVARSLTVSGSGESIVSVEVNISGSAASGGTAFLGDLYFYLTNGSEAAILVNRPGRRAGTPGGYSDNQSFNVTFSESGANDFHNYRVPVTGSHTTALGGPLTGLWQPDGRLVDPGIVLDTNPRTAGLGIFAGDPADGTWSLFAADLSTGGVHQVASWSLRIETIPEPATVTLGLAALAGLLNRRRRAGGS